MAVNADKSHRWKSDVARSVDFYNQWFIQFAPVAFREKRVEATEQVRRALALTSNLRDIRPDVIRDNPEVLSMLRMATAPPLARDRLIGLTGVRRTLVQTMEGKLRTPTKAPNVVYTELQKIGEMIGRLADRDLFPWLDAARPPTDAEVYRAATVVADRLCGVMADPIIRNAQEQRQLEVIKGWLVARDYLFIAPGAGLTVHTMDPGTFAFRLNVSVSRPALLSNLLEEPSGGIEAAPEVIGLYPDASATETAGALNIPVDVVVMPLTAHRGELPVMIEAKSAGDFANTNKRRKEEAAKATQLHATFGDKVKYILFLCGYFDAGYLGYEAAEGIDWVWEHRLEDLAEFGL